MDGNKDFIGKMIDLICGSEDKGQVVEYVAKSMKNEFEAKSGLPPLGLADGTGRIGQLQNLFDPKHASPSSLSDATRIFLDNNAYDSGVQLNNNPLFPSNLVDRMNTPFDYLDRILLQDFSDMMFSSKGNFFRDMYTVDGKGIRMEEFPFIHLDGEFHVDSFTYTPFIDHMCSEDGDASAGAYADQFLTAYNQEKFNGPGYADTNRRRISSSLFRLRDLEKDIEDERTAFRNSIENETDSKVYIHTFCEHLANLFAKLSNIRMCHEIYGFKHPHHEWEGILALDIWYQMLYKAIDEKYPFDETKLGMNPMFRKKVLKDSDGHEYVMMDGKKKYIADIDTKEREEAGWGSDVDQDSAYVWDQSLWDEYVDTAKKIHDRRPGCVTPRGVLEKIYGIVARRDGFSISDITEISQSGDFDWFHQPGNEYDESMFKSPWSNHVNLHLGRAYETMSVRDYCELMDVPSYDGVHLVKPAIPSEETMRVVRTRMLDAGFNALEDAFNVLLNEKMFNIYNSTSDSIEEFNPSCSDSYSQAECAVVIERIFSRIYTYLQFKSTTSETFPRHVNIDTGYKYLTSSTILRSDNKAGRKPYFNDIDDGDSIPYIRYLMKVQDCMDDENIGLTEDERQVLGQFISTLKVKESGWVSSLSDKYASRWSLCPLIQDGIADSSSSSILNSDSSRSVLMVEMPETGDMLMLEYGSPQSRPSDYDDAQQDGGDSGEDQQGGGGDGEDSGTSEETVGRTFTVKFLDEDGEMLDSFQVKENTHIPFFHLHGTPERRFSHWRLKSGKITSSMTVLSDIELAAVYVSFHEYGSSDSDLIMSSSGNMESCDGWLESAQDFFYYDSSSTSSSASSSIDSSFDQPYCKFLKTSTDGNVTKCWCSLCGLDPTAFDDDFSETMCPFIKFLNKSRNSRFDVLSAVDIKDVIDLLRALFKINIHIAHDERYVKIDIPEVSDYWYGYRDGDNRWISFEPTVEYKFCNLHAANQKRNGKLLCTVSEKEVERSVVPFNRELMNDSGSVQYSDLLYHYDYFRRAVVKVVPDDAQRLYSVTPLHLYANSDIRHPSHPTTFVRHRLNEIDRNRNQIQTFTSILKKYRPAFVPDVWDIFNSCLNNKSKHEVDMDNTYGIFGWCTIPSKTMVNMEYNEHTIFVPSSYDHHNRVGGDNFLQMDSDLKEVYKVFKKQDDGDIGQTYIAAESWCYLYNTRDWTYFMSPVFNVSRNHELCESRLLLFRDDRYKDHHLKPRDSDHINGVIYENSIERGRDSDKDFGMMVEVCQFLARRHHGEGSLLELASKWNGAEGNLLSFERMKSLTSDGEEFNAIYGSKYADLPSDYVFPFQDWVDDYNKTGSYLESSDSNLAELGEEDVDTIQFKYKYNLGQAHAIDDFDEDSVWLYITVLDPTDQLEPVVQIEDIMPYVFWWSNRGRENNGPVANCYGIESSSRLNYKSGGWCYSGYNRRDNEEERWHAVSHTLGMDFAQEEYGGIRLMADDSGNVYKGAFDPRCSATEAKWRVHGDTAFGLQNQKADPLEDKYYRGEECGGEIVDPIVNNEYVLASIKNKPMTWNLWNVVRHYVYIKWFRDMGRTIAKGDESSLIELERRTKKIVKGIYRTFQENKLNVGTERSATFNDVDGIETHVGGKCLVNWTNSFVEISSFLERNAREHDASLVMFTGHGQDGGDTTYGEVKGSKCNFVVNTLDGADTEKTGIDPAYKGFKYHNMPTNFILGDDSVVQQAYPDTTFQLSETLNMDEEYPYSEFHKGSYSDKWIRKITHTVLSRQTIPVYTSMENMDKSVNELSDEDMKSITFQIVPQLYWRYEWAYTDLMIHRVGKTFPVGQYGLYDMLGNVWELTRDKWTERQPRAGEYLGEADFPPTDVEEDIPASSNSYLASNIDPYGSSTTSEPGSDIIYFNAAGLSSSPAQRGLYVDNTYVEDVKKGDYATYLSTTYVYNGSEWEESPSPSNPIGDAVNRSAVIKGGAFDQLIRKVISPAREKISLDASKSSNATQDNVGFRPAMTFTSEKEKTTYDVKPVDLFFLFDASSSQDSQVQDMIDQAQEIIKIFAPRDKNQKEMCRVGSALFLGPTMRLMCAMPLQEKPLKQRYVHSNTIWTVKMGKSSGQAYDKSFPSDFLPSWNGSIYGRPSFSVKGLSKDKRKLWDEQGWVIADSPEDVSKLLLNKFKQIKYEDTELENKDASDSDVQTDQQTRSSEPSMMLKSVPQFRSAAPLSSPASRSSSDGMMMTTRAGSEGSSSAGVNTGNPVGITANATLTTWYGGTKTMGVFKGATAWVDDNDNEKLNISAPFYTWHDMETFNYPFKISNEYTHTKGCLSEFWAGSEPVCDVLAQFLRTGAYVGYPYHDGFGFKFRQNVRRLIFVFTNEFDNPVTKTYSTGSGGVPHQYVVLPGADKKKVKFYHLSETLESTTKETLGTTPPDPYCLRILNSVQPTGSDEISKYLDSIIKDDTERLKDDMLKSVKDLRSRIIVDDDKKVPDLKYNTGNVTNAVIDYKGWDGQISDSQEIVYPDASTMKRQIDMYHRDKPFSGLNLTQILTDEQIQGIKDGEKVGNKGSTTFAGVTYKRDGNKLKPIEADYSALKSLGFYSLRNILTRYSPQTDIFLMVGNANAPTPLYDVDTSNWRDNDWKTEANLKKVADSIYMAMDSDFFKPIEGLALPKITVKNGENETELNWPSGIKTFKDLVESNAKYHGSQVGKSNVEKLFKLASSYRGVVASLGLHNPYTTNNVIYAYRKDWDKLWKNKDKYTHVMGLSYSDAHSNNVKAHVNVGSQDWKNMHLVPVNHWFNLEQCRYRREHGLMGRWNLTDQNCELFLVKVQGNEVTNIAAAPITTMVSAESFRVNDDLFGNDAYAWRKTAIDWIHLSYKDANNNETGHLKIVTSPYPLVGSTSTSSAGGIVIDEGKKITSDSVMKILLTPPQNNSYPTHWQNALHIDANNAYKTLSGDSLSSKSKGALTLYKIDAESWWTSPGYDYCVKWVKGFYDLLKKGLPVLMAYRWHSQILSQLVNRQNRSVVDYDQSNNVTIRAIPIMNASEMKDTFNSAFDSDGFKNASQNDGDSQCVIDLNPDLTKNENKGLQDGQFPMIFTNDVRVNEDNTYKTSKIVLSRIDSISGSNSDTFIMGSRSSDYEKVSSDESKLASADAILEGSEDNFTTVTLTNGGSCQKNEAFYSIPDPSDERRRKYFKNKHFYIDPFQLTIAQWCHVYGKHTQKSAREFLGDRLNEMRRSYLRYLNAYEPDEWEQLFDVVPVDPTLETSSIIDAIVAIDEERADKRNDQGDYDEKELPIYNPLEDTRPWYYATYNSVRGTDAIYTSADGANSGMYLFNNERKDEFQLNTVPENSNAFLSILNGRTVFKCKAKTYEDGYQSDGGRMYISPGKNDEEQWCRGEAAGINFDLPTEAQWEYCCRAGTGTAFPGGDLGQVYDTNIPQLDLIAWYRYKLIGSLPEPERFAAWRISKMLFGISKNSAIVNNVYEVAAPIVSDKDVSSSQSSSASSLIYRDASQNENPV